MGESMATIGGNLYAEPVHTFFEALGNYDAAAACSVLADDADLVSPWNAKALTGRAEIEELFTGILSDPKRRPSFTIQDIRGDGHIVRLDVSISGRFGMAPQNARISCLHLHDKIHHVIFEGRDGPLHVGGLAVQVPYIDFKGDVDDVIDIEGIGPVYAKRLASAGIRTTARLCYEPVGRVAEIAEAELATVDGWKSMAELMKISGVGGQYAECLFRGGVTGITDFQGKDPVAVTAAINEYFAGVKTTVQKNDITEKRVAGWAMAAKAMKPGQQPIPKE